MLRVSLASATFIWSFSVLFMGMSGTSTLQQAMACHTMPAGDFIVFTINDFCEIAVTLTLGGPLCCTDINTPKVFLKRGGGGIYNRNMSFNNDWRGISLIGGMEGGLQDSHKIFFCCLIYFDPVC